MSSDARRSSAKNATLTNTITHTAHVAQRNMSHHSSSCFMFKLAQTRDKDALFIHVRTRITGKS